MTCGIAKSTARGYSSVDSGAMPADSPAIRWAFLLPRSVRYVGLGGSPPRPFVR